MVFFNFFCLQIIKTEKKVFVYRFIPQLVRLTLVFGLLLRNHKQQNKLNQNILSIVSVRVGFIIVMVKNITRTDGRACLNRCRK